MRRDRDRDNNNDRAKEYMDIVLIVERFFDIIIS
jgi:hypothetical protein